ncbi:MAG: MFS transporter [Candidatus Wallbacteria bacterium]|nr:MFS transporter [Candidatus Wallbacteria bacterium]
MNSEELKLIQAGRRKFAAMASTYFLGVFNDNFFKQAALLMAISAGLIDFQGYATVIFTLPFLIFASYAGWLSDRFSKRSVMIGSKVLELIAMLAGAAGICTGSWVLIFTMLGIMGIQAAVFSPALNGSIPELYPAWYVIKANAIVKMISTTAIFGGIAMAGLVLSRRGAEVSSIPWGQFLVALSVVSVSILGLIVSFGAPSRPAAAPEKKFPRSGPLETFRTIQEIQKDPLLNIAVMSNMFLWFCGSMMTMIVNPLGLKQYCAGEAVTSFMNVVFLTGIAAGGFISSRLAVGERWYRVLSPAALIMSVMMGLMVLVPHLPVGHDLQVMAIFINLAGIGLCGGVFLIPLESFVQVRPAADRKGSVISAANFSVFSGILVSGLVANFLNAWLLPTQSFAVMSIMSLSVSIWQYFVLNKGRLK